jgi:hypothetical protein
MHDKVQHGTDAVGERNPRSIFTEDQVRSIRKLLTTEQITVKGLAKALGCSRVTLTKIRDGRAWKHVA